MALDVRSQIALFSQELNLALILGTSSGETLYPSSPHNMNTLWALTRGKFPNYYPIKYIQNQLNMSKLT